MTGASLMLTAGLAPPDLHNMKNWVPLNTNVQKFLHTKFISCMNLYLDKMRGYLRYRFWINVKTRVGGPKVDINLDISSQER